MKKEIYFNEINLLMGSGGIVYLPFVSGVLSSYIKTSKFLKNKIKVMPFIFIPDPVDKLIKKYNKLLEKTNYKNIYVQAAPGDSGGALGSAGFLINSLDEKSVNWNPNPNCKSK